ncbi:MAG: hypothetical protein U0270_32400 [Labilithrix sp.]
MNRRSTVLVLAALAVLAGCAAASGYDAKRYANTDAGAPDPDTAALPTVSRTTIPDPKKPPPPPPPAPAPAPAPVEEDAGPPDAGPTAKPTKPKSAGTKN